ncbi:MAG: exo-alpha-sialidase [Clostridium sp.]|nr:exo-alpha-sialidase [Clostridium sp.]
MKGKLITSIGLSLILTLTPAIQGMTYVYSQTIDYSDKLLDKTNMIFDNTLKTAISNSEGIQDKLELIKKMSKGSFTFRYRLNEEQINSEIVGLMSMSVHNEASGYGAFFFRPTTGKFGIEVKGKSLVEVQAPVNTVNNTQWHTVTYVFTGNEMNVYLDGENLGSVAFQGLFSDNTSWVPRATKLTVGGLYRSESLQWGLSGYIEKIEVGSDVLTAEQVNSIHKETNSSDYPIINDEFMKTSEYGLWDAYDEDVYMYRIPSLVKTKDGTLVAAADARKKHWNDWGDIATVVRTSTDNGSTWSKNTTVLDMPTQPYYTQDVILGGSDIRSALSIDPVLLSASNGDLFLLVDMFPESQAGVSSKLGTGYVEVDGKSYLELTDDSGNKYTVREEGKVYSSTGELTEYTVSNGDYEHAFANKGDLYSNGKRLGNIYLNGTAEGNDSAPLKAYVTSYLWLFKSTDNGQTWSDPIDLNPEVKEDWMRFMGSGPGNGLEVVKADGSVRLMFPVYYTNANGSGIGKQSSANIYSDDGGITWHRGESPNDGRIYGNGLHASSQTLNNEVTELGESQIVQLKNGHLLQFLRNRGTNKTILYAISEDYGETWSDTLIDTGLYEPYCQMSVISMDVDGKESLVLSNPAGGGTRADGRENGTIRIGEVQDNDTINWVSERLIKEGRYAYSTLCQLDDDHVGVLYEYDGHIKYTSMNIDYIQNKNISFDQPAISEVTKEVIKDSNNEPSIIQVGDLIRFNVRLNQNVFVLGEQKLDITIGANNKSAKYVSGSGTNNIVFDYTVGDGDSGDLVVNHAMTGSIVENVYGSSLLESSNKFELGIVGFNPEDASRDLKDVDAAAGSFENGHNASMSRDDKNETYWESRSTDLSKHYVTLYLDKEYNVDGLRYLPAANEEGRITEYEIQVSDNPDDSFVTVATGTWENTEGWKIVKFDKIHSARYVRIVSTNPTNGVSAIAELSATGIEKATEAQKLEVQVEPRYNTVRLEWNNIAAATKYVIKRAEAVDGTYETIRELDRNATKFIDETGYGKKYYYEVKAPRAGAQTLVSDVLTFDGTTGLETLIKNSQLGVQYENTTFDGNRIETYNDKSTTIQSLEKGSIIMKFKKNGNFDKDTVMLGLKNKATPTTLTGGSQVASFWMGSDKIFHLAFPITGSQAKSNIGSDSGWHTLVLSNDSAGKTYRLTVDGEEVWALTNTKFNGFFSKFSNLNQITVGGHLSTTGVNEYPFIGEIAYVAITDEILTDKEAKDLTKGVTIIANKDALVAIINEAKALDPSVYTDASITELRTQLENAKAINADQTVSQKAVDDAIGALDNAIKAMVKKESIEITYPVIEEGSTQTIGLHNVEEAKALLLETAEELSIVKDALANGQKVELVVEANPLTDVTENDRKKFEDFAKDTETNYYNRLNIAGYFELKVFLKIDDVQAKEVNVENINELSETLIFNLVVDKNLVSKNRKFKTLALVDDNVGKFYTELKNNNIEIETYKLGLCALSYQDKKAKAVEVDKAKLEKLIAEAEKINKDEYTEISYNAMAEKLEAAKIILEDKNVNQEAVDNVAKELQTAIDNLVKKEESNEPPVVTPTTPTNSDNSTNIPKSDNPTELVKTGDESVVLSAITALVLLATGTVLLKRRKTREGENI